MANGEPSNILIIGENTPRTSSLTKLITGGYDGNVSVSVISPDDLLSLSNEGIPDLCLVDLAGSDQPSHVLIKQIRDILPDVKIIVLHIYSSPELIEPLYNMGVNGYLKSEPTRKELIRAINAVCAGDTWFPDGLA